MKINHLFKEKKKRYKKIPKEEKSFNYKRKGSKNKRKIICFSFVLILYTLIVIYITSFMIKKGNSSWSTEIKNIENKIKILKYLTNNDKTFYEGAKNCLEKDPDEQLCIYQFLCPKEVINKKRILIGNHEDGSYVMLDDFKNIKIAYSIGIDGLIQFDKALADKGIDVYMYDHTIDKLPYENEKFHWKKIGIGGNNDRTSNIQTLTDMMKDNGHLNEKNIILKIDVEGPEWKSLNDVPEDVLKQFRFILVEYHFFQLYPKLYYNVLKKMYKTHQVFFVNCCSLPDVKTFGNNRICVCIEVSYALRSEYSFAKDESIYPIEEFAYSNQKGFNPNILKLFDEYK